MRNVPVLITAAGSLWLCILSDGHGDYKILVAGAVAALGAFLIGVQ